MRMHKEIGQSSSTRNFKAFCELHSYNKEALMYWAYIMVASVTRYYRAHMYFFTH